MTKCLFEFAKLGYYLVLDVVEVQGLDALGVLSDRNRNRVIRLNSISIYVSVSRFFLSRHFDANLNECYQIRLWSHVGNVALHTLYYVWKMLQLCVFCHLDHLTLCHYFLLLLLFWLETCKVELEIFGIFS